MELVALTDHQRWLTRLCVRAYVFRSTFWHDGTTINAVLRKHATRCFFWSAYKIYDRNAIAITAELFYSQFLCRTHAVNLNIYISCTFTVFPFSRSICANGYAHISGAWKYVAVNTLKLTHLIGASHSLLYRICGSSECIICTSHHFLPLSFSIIVCKCALLTTFCMLPTVCLWIIQVWAFLFTCSHFSSAALRLAKVSNLSLDIGALKPMHSTRRNYTMQCNVSSKLFMLKY